MSVVCCQVEVPVANWSLAQRSPTDCGASCLWSRKNLVNEEAIARVGLQGHVKNIYIFGLETYVLYCAACRLNTDTLLGTQRTEEHCHIHAMEYNIIDQHINNLLHT
jgi:hypothetical protein